MPVPVHVVVGEFDLLEGDNLLAQLLASKRRVRVDVEPGGSRGIGLARHEPAAPVIGVAITFLVHGDDVHQHRITALRPKAIERYPARRKHPPVIREKPTVFFSLSWIAGSVFLRIQWFQLYSLSQISHRSDFFYY